MKTKFYWKSILIWRHIFIHRHTSAHISTHIASCYISTYTYILLHNHTHTHILHTHILTHIHTHTYTTHILSHTSAAQHSPDSWRWVYSASPAPAPLCSDTACRRRTGRTSAWACPAAARPAGTPPAAHSVNTNSQYW